MQNSRLNYSGRLVGALGFALWLVLCLGSSLVHAQLGNVRSVKGFSRAYPYEGDNFKQTKFQIAGDEGTQLPGGKLFQVKGAKMQRFKVTGEIEITVEAPDCLFDTSAQTASSPGHLRVQTGDQRLLIEGDGYSWKDPILIISNNVRSEIRQLDPQTHKISTKAPMLVTSRWFTFDAERREGTFHDNVKGSDPQIDFSSGNLLVGATTNGESFERLLAEPNVSILRKTNNSTATAQRMIYTKSSETIELFGDAKWKEGPQQGKADHWVLKSRENSFAGDGNVAIAVPRSSFGLDGIFDSSGNPKTKSPKDAPPLNIYADRFQSSTNKSLTIAIAEGSVRVVDSTNQLACDKLTMRSTKGEKADDTGLAEGNVVVTQGDANHQIRGPRAEYAKSTGLVVFKGNPEWKFGEIEGRANRLTMNQRTHVTDAAGDVVSKVTLSGQDAGLDLIPIAGETNRTPRVIELYGDNLHSQDQLVTLSGNAHAHQLPITGKEPRLRSDLIEMRFGTNMHTTETIRALNNVVYEKGTAGVTNGADTYVRMQTPTLTAKMNPDTGLLSTVQAENGVVVEMADSIAKGGRATYTKATDVLELIDHPSSKSPKGEVRDAQKLIWNRSKGEFEAGPGYHLELEPKALNVPIVKTNKP